MEGKKIQCYVTVDSEGNLTNAIFGEKVIPSNDDNWDFFFWVDDYLDIEEWKVVMIGMKPEMILKGGVEN